MKRLLPLVLVAAGCAGGDNTRELQFEMGLASRIAIDMTKLKRGEYAVYTLRVAGKPEIDYVKYAVVDDDRTSIWLENKIPGESMPIIVKTRFDRTTAKILEQWIGEVGSLRPNKSSLSPEKANEPAQKRDSSVAEQSSKEEPDQIVVAGKTWAATKVTTTLTYPNGRKSVLVDWYHPEVPFPVLMRSGKSEKSYGGLVKRQIGQFTMELTVWGEKGAQSELEIPQEK